MSFRFVVCILNQRQQCLVEPALPVDIFSIVNSDSLVNVSIFVCKNPVYRRSKGVSLSHEALDGQVTDTPKTQKLGEQSLFRIKNPHIILRRTLICRSYDKLWADQLIFYWLLWLFWSIDHILGNELLNFLRRDIFMFHDKFTRCIVVVHESVIVVKP